MTRRITANFYMTLDGLGEFPKYPGSDTASKEPDLTFTELLINQYDSVDTVIFGRRAFEDHQNYHSEVARKPDDPEYMFEFSRWLDRSQKIVLSHFMKKTTWQNSTIMSGDLNEVVSKLKAQPGKNIMVDGGPSVVQEFVARGLVDDYRMAVSPVIYGRGAKHYWGTMVDQQTLKLLEVKALPYGELYLHYEAVRG
jgi:dihydrofolate reductase